MKPAYDAHRALVGQAQAGNHTTRHLLFGCFVIILLGYVLTTFLFQTIVSMNTAAGGAAITNALFDGTTPGAMFILLFSFGLWPIAIWAALHLVHRRPLMPVFGYHAVTQFRKVLWALILLNIALVLLPPWDAPLPEGEITQNLPFGRWLLLLPLSLLAVLVQVSAEELLFRGYLQQQLAARWSAPAVWLVIPSVIFGLLHYDASAGSNAWLIAIWAIIFGLMMADLTARSGSLGPAIAVHLVNNVIAMVLYGLPEDLGGLALYHYPAGLDDEAMVRALLPLDFALMLVSWLAARLALRR